MIVLDSNVFSALMREVPDPPVTAWLDKQARTSIWITSVTVFEIRYGLEILADGKRKVLLAKAFATVLDRIDQRVAPFDTAAAQHAADLMAARRKLGRSVDLRDTMIAGIVLARHATLATRNTGHFADISTALINPWNA
jgi:toxin FitB